MVDVVGGGGVVVVISGGVGGSTRPMPWLPQYSAERRIPATSLGAGPTAAEVVVAYLSQWLRSSPGPWHALWLWPWP